MKKYSASSRYATRAYVDVGPPTAPEVPQSVPNPAAGQLPPPSQMRPMSSRLPAYSPGLSMPSRVGVAGAWLIVVFGRIETLTVSEPGPRVEFVVLTGTFADWLVGSVASVLVSFSVPWRRRPARSARSRPTGSPT